MNIKIGGTTYPVTYRADLNDNHKTLYGWIRFNASEILIEEELGPQARYAVLWHEIVHGILNHAGIDDNDEKWVSAMGYGIIQVLRDNPALIQMLGELYGSPT